MALQEELEEQGVWLFKYRGVLPIGILVLGLLMYVWSELHPERYFMKDNIYENYYLWFCIAVGLLGLFIRIYTVGHTPKNTSGRNTDEQVADTLNTTGIYSTVRHPLYVGNFFMWLGPALLTQNLWFIISFCLFYWVYYERIMFAEEQFLRRKFESTYTKWAETLPAFIPSFKNFVKPKYPFSWKKVIKKEKNGLAALFLVFALFDVVGKWIGGTEDYNWFLIYVALASGVVYFILKYLKKYTQVFEEEGR